MTAALRSIWERARPSGRVGEEPIRAEVFSVERLEQHAESLATAQIVTARPTRGRSVARRLRANAKVLLRAYRAIALASHEHRAITPAAEWLVDNFHIVEDQIREVRDDLPHGFYRQLPKLAGGPLEGLPRVLGMAWAYVAHTDSRFDPETLCRFVRAYQRVQPLTIGELWAVAITLRIVLVENLRRAAERIVDSRKASREADALADRLLDKGAAEVVTTAAELRRLAPGTFSREFAVQLLQRLRDHDPSVMPFVAWMDGVLSNRGTNADELVRQEHQRQGAMNVTVRNAITSMRLMSSIDWAELFESVSLVDATLRADSDFAAMDFPTRDRYRHAIEELARHSPHSELEVARHVIRATEREKTGRRKASEIGARREEDPGYFLISGGRGQLERTLSFRVPIHQWTMRGAVWAGLPGYLGSLSVTTGLLLAPALWTLSRFGVGDSTLGLLAVLGLIPASEAALTLLNHFVTTRIGPRALPGLELRDGVPARLRTLVVVPTLLTSSDEIEAQIDRLEIHALASPDDELRFALLSDWSDAATEHASDDDALLGVARLAIESLNRRHPVAAGGDRFLLLHRRRVWCASEGRWMGWERKRGKLVELNRLLRGAIDTTYLFPVEARGGVPDGVRYVVTLDGDTRIPRDAARRLVGKLAHPLNRPRIDRESGRVVEGHAVLQPRVTPSLPTGREGSLFQRIHSGRGGMDPYAFAVSDVYQDLFGEGSYSGKGGYDVDAFSAALEGRIPDDTLLSHDLFEGIFARAGLATDIEVVEDHPARYDVSAARQHRWARGDWQLLPWIFGIGSRHARRPTRGGIPLVGRWKMLDNLRRTLIAPAAFMALVVGWLMPPSAALVWTSFVVATFTIPTLMPLLVGLIPRRLGISKRSHLNAVGGDLSLSLSRVGFVITLLPHQAWIMSDAIVRTLFRVFVSHRRMLEWMTEAQAALGPRLELGGFYARMAGGVALTIVAIGAVASSGSASWLVALPFVVPWLLAPAIARWASVPTPVPRRNQISPEDARALRMTARRTWRFFETFVGPADHMLPPDNFQEDPDPIVAHRTSPTNMGLYLLSVVAARDFSWLGLHETIDRLEATLASMESLERHRGHFYNWYATRDLRPLDPKYVSTVDSGNLAGHLIALERACLEMIDAPLISPDWPTGIADTLAQVHDALRALADARRTQTVTRSQLDEVLEGIARLLAPPRDSALDVAIRFDELGAQSDALVDIARTLCAERGDEATAEVLAWTESLDASIRGHARDVAASRVLRGGPSGSPARCARDTADLRDRLLGLARRASRLGEDMQFGFLFHPTRQLLSIGYRISDGELDPSCYDLLASEARLASFVAIAKGEIPVRHWFRLGRALTPIDHGSALISWSGSMFEYLMPSLVMRAPLGSLLEQTSRFIVRRQMQYGAELRVPWGISESAYNARDIELTYQYSNFGVPGLGLKRGLSENAVVAPYATGLAAMVHPEAAARNFERLEREGGRGRYGWYEALDYTPSRLPEGRPVAIVRAYMAHHQGMTLVSILNALQDGRMRSRFHADPSVRATDLLLQERTPRDVAVARPRAEEVDAAENVRELVPTMLRRFHSPHDTTPRTHLLSNGRYAVMMTAAGSGYSRWGAIAMTRWREDPTCDGWGSYVFLRDVESGEVWSAGHQPSGTEADAYEVAFSEDRVEIVRRDGTLTTTLAVTVSTEDDAEVRRVSISNLGSRPREIELTSYAELVLLAPAADAAHPAFSKLFVQTEFVADVGALLATRRRRAPEEPEIWAGHLVVVEGESRGEVQFETDRARFLGRGHGVRNPISVVDGRALSGSVGTVLDPIFSLRRRVRIAPGATARVAFWTLVAPSRAEALDLVDKHHDPAAFERAVTLAWTQAQVQLRHLGIDTGEAQLFQRLANRVLYSDPTLRPGSDVLRRCQGGPSALWPHGISGDRPIVLVRIDDIEDLAIVRQLLRAHEYWRMKRLAVDLVILNERHASYTQDLQIALETLVRASPSSSNADEEGTCGSIFVLRSDLVSTETRAVLRTAARAVLLSRRGSLAEQVKRREGATPARSPHPRRSLDRVASEPPRPRIDLEHFNGLGGFADRGREYVTILGAGQWTPAPWINVVANAGFGFQVSAEGGGYTWAENSRENQLTPWSNDPIGDRPGEVFYVRDEDDDALFTPTALPIRDEAGQYVARHGQGYSVFEHTAHGIALELTQFVAPNDPIKISRLRVENRTSRTRRLSMTAYVEWTLAATGRAGGPFIVSEVDAETGAFFARNPWNGGCEGRVAFLDLAGRQLAWTGDRTEFLGRNGALDGPAALARGARLSNRVGAGLDPCGVLQAEVVLEAHSGTEIVCFLGQTASAEEARALVARFRAADLDEVLRAVRAGWSEILETVQVSTPDRSFDLMTNRWLLYQTLACRMWARSAFYQASGAFGFRDQLQDAMALTLSRPALTRAHLLHAASRQFVAGDVQHWWLPSSGLGVRTRMSDDAIWLAFATAQYVDSTGELGVLDADVAFLAGPELRPDQHDAFFAPTQADEHGSLFEHCARTLDRALAVGSHGLPLFGTGDWNDGMNRVGSEGRGESVWLGWFLHATISAFAPLAEARGETARAASWRRHADLLAQSIEREAWDGEWYLRGFFDDGTPLGSAASEECRIDSIAQSWGVLSGAANPERAARAMASVEAQLVRREQGLIALFTPPFDRTPLDPGYIKGYPPGIRENGGQYTQAALWAIQAFARLGEGDKATELLAMLNPIRRASTRAALHRYKVEPYVVAADVYSEPPHVGRGGWSWYTGSAGWMYRVGLESILGFHVRGATIVLDPCIPSTWPGFRIAYRHGGAHYEIEVENPRGVCRGVTSIELDGATVRGDASIPLIDDGKLHRVRVVLG
ncbi:MAG: glycosyl transferase [Deltaproteobacteria bacterium]|nr:glycosyl transferase [Deltaproteobacteria bacterium]